MNEKRAKIGVSKKLAGRWGVFLVLKKRAKK